MVPIAGLMSDRFGAKPVMLSCGYSYCHNQPLPVTGFSAPDATTLIFCQCLMGAVIELFTGPAPDSPAALYPTSVRSTGISISYNSAVTLFGGFAPFIATWLIGLTGSSSAPSYYVIAAGLLAILGMSLIKKIDVDPRVSGLCSSA